jgi:hypothetical protein
MHFVTELVREVAGHHLGTTSPRRTYPAHRLFSVPTSPLMRSSNLESATSPSRCVQPNASAWFMALYKVSLMFFLNQGV